MIFSQGNCLLPLKPSRSDVCFSYMLHRQLRFIPVRLTFDRGNDQSNGSGPGVII